MSNQSNLQLQRSRCDWVNNDPQYILYHDTEWGYVEFDSFRLFEILCLEGQQAGLSWITILKKRKNYRKLFYNFNPYKISKMTEIDIALLINDTGIIRHRGKIESIINNAKCFIEMENKGENFSKFIWSFVNNTPIINNWETINEVPSKTSISFALSKGLKNRGFKFVGSTTCYAFMQACGLVNDHVLTCYCREINN